MSNLFAVTFENGALYHPISGFEGVVVNGGSIEVNAGSKQAGNYGCQITPLINYRSAGYRYTGPLTRFRQAFYFHRNNYSIVSTNSIRICRDYHNDASLENYVVRLYFVTGTGYQIAVGISDNTGAITVNSGYYTLDNQDDWNLIETDWSSGSPGFMKLWINGSLKETITATNNLVRVMYPSLCAIQPFEATSGSYFFDNWRANNDGAEIGA